MIFETLKLHKGYIAIICPQRSVLHKNDDVNISGMQPFHTGLPIFVHCMWKIPVELSNLPSFSFKMVGPLCFKLLSRNLIQVPWWTSGATFSKFGNLDLNINCWAKLQYTALEDKQNRMPHFIQYCLLWLYYSAQA